jgi:hypothetical protein
VSDQVYASAAVHPARYSGFIVVPTAHAVREKAFRVVCYTARN